jgi:hypothetical protein
MKAFNNYTLNPKLWKDDKLKPHIRSKLLWKSKEFLSSVGVTDDNIVDIIFTGSNAHYHYTDLSDIDIHHVFLGPKHGVFSDEKVFAAYVNVMKRNREKFYIDDLYVDFSNVHAKNRSTKWSMCQDQGNYSILKGKWNQRPTKRDEFIDDENLFKKAKIVFDNMEKSMSEGKKKEAFVFFSELNSLRTRSMNLDGEYCSVNMLLKELKKGDRLKKIVHEILKE